MNKILIFLLLFLVNVSCYGQLANNTSTKDGKWGITNGTNYATAFIGNTLVISNSFIIGNTTNTASTFTNIMKSTNAFTNVIMTIATSNAVTTNGNTLTLYVKTNYSGTNAFTAFIMTIATSNSIRTNGNTLTLYVKTNYSGTNAFTGLVVVQDTSNAVTTNGNTLNLYVKTNYTASSVSTSSYSAYSNVFYPTITVALANGNLQSYFITNTTAITIVNPPNTTQVHSVRVEVIPDTNSVSLISTNCDTSAITSIPTGTTTTILFDFQIYGTNWRAFKL